MFKELNNLKLFFDEPNREFHLRELGRLMKLNPVTVKTMLMPFAENKAIIIKKDKGFELYRANIENLNYKMFKREYNKLRIIESGILDFIKENYDLPTVILFGSYARGEDNKNSDIDLFILGNNKKLKDLRDSEDFQKIARKINKEIQLHILNMEEFNKAKKHNPALINNIINGVVLSGFIEVL